MAGPRLIDVRGLEKTFRSKILRRPSPALRGLDLAVEEGEIFGFLGPNGAGKTTTIRILLGLIRPTGGTGTLLGRPFGSVEARHQVGFLPDSPNFYRYLSARELLRFAGQLHGLSGHDLERRIEATLERVGLAPEARGRQLRTYSRGMLQRTGIAAAILHRPRLVIMDEPMSGLDPLGRRDFRDLIRALKEEGTTVFLSSHVLADVESTADRVGILDRGRLVRCGSLKEILSGDGRRIEIAFELRGGTGLEEVARQLRRFRPGPIGWLGEVDGPEEASRVVRDLLAAGGRLLSYGPKRVSLEEFFLGQIGGGAAAEARPGSAAAAPSGRPVRAASGQEVER